MENEESTLRRLISGQDVAEIEIEARRDAQESGGDIRQNPYSVYENPFGRLVYTDECSKIRRVLSQGDTNNDS